MKKFLLFPKRTLERDDLVPKETLELLEQPQGKVSPQSLLSTLYTLGKLKGKQHPFLEIERLLATPAYMFMSIVKLSCDSSIAIWDDTVADDAKMHPTLGAKTRETTIYLIHWAPATRAGAREELLNLGDGHDDFAVAANLRTSEMR